MTHSRYQKLTRGAPGSERVIPHHTSNLSEEKILFQYLSTVTLTWCPSPQYPTQASHPPGPLLHVSHLLGSHHFPPVSPSFVPPHQGDTCSLSRCVTSFTARLTPVWHPSSVVTPPHHFTPATQLPGTTATLSGLIMSFLLMVPEAASPSGPPSSRMSRTSAPVAIAPKGWGSAPRSRVSAWRGTRLRSGGGATSAPSGGGVRRRAAMTTVAQGQVGTPPVSRHLSLPNGPSYLLSLRASTPRVPGCVPAAPLSPQSRGQKLPVVQARNVADRNASGLC